MVMNILSIILVGCFIISEPWELDKSLFGTWANILDFLYVVASYSDSDEVIHARGIGSGLGIFPKTGKVSK